MFQRESYDEIADVGTFKEFQCKNTIFSPKSWKTHNTVVQSVKDQCKGDMCVGFLHETASVIMAGLINMTHMETPALTNGANR